MHFDMALCVPCRDNQRPLTHIAHVLMFETLHLTNICQWGGNARRMLSKAMCHVFGLVKSFVRVSCYWAL